MNNSRQDVRHEVVVFLSESDGGERMSGYRNVPGTKADILRMIPVEIAGLI
jgi:hypothetical protein